MKTPKSESIAQWRIRIAREKWKKPKQAGKWAQKYFPGSDSNWTIALFAGIFALGLLVLIWG